MILKIRKIHPIFMNIFVEKVCNLTESRNASDIEFGGVCFEPFASDILEHSWKTVTIRQNIPVK